MHGCKSGVFKHFIAFFCCALLLVHLDAAAQTPHFRSITGSSTLPILRWSPVAGAPTYELQVATDGNFSSLVADDSTISDTIRAIGPLPADTGYYCRVAGFTPGGLKDWSTPLRFYAESARCVFTLPVAPGWNLLSLPLSVSDSTRNFLFPGPCTSPTAFCYYGSYDCCTGYLLQHTYGFWAHYSVDQVMGVTGLPLTADTESLSTGWNLIGSVLTPLPRASVSTIPPGLTLGNFFGYSPFSYVAVDTIQPFKGYWVRAAGPGQMILPQSEVSPCGIIAYVHWQGQPVAGIKILLVETGDSVYTDSNGMAAFTVPAGNYTVRAFDINRGGPTLISVDFNVAVKPGETITVDIVDCLPCD